MWLRQTSEGGAAYIHTAPPIGLATGNRGRVNRVLSVCAGGRLTYLLPGSAFTRDSFTPKLFLHSSLILLFLHLHCSRHCTTNAQYETPHPTPLCMSYTIQYWQWQYRVKPKGQRGLYIDTAPPIGLAIWPLQDIILRRGLYARINHPFIPRARLHCLCWCNTIPT